MNEIADICRRIPYEPAQSFHEALQELAEHFNVAETLNPKRNMPRIEKRKALPEEGGRAADGNMFEQTKSQYEILYEAVNSQIRALTKGDVTKEKEVLAIDTWRALTELNALAKEYDDFNKKYPNK